MTTHRCIVTEQIEIKKKHDVLPYEVTRFVSSVEKLLREFIEPTHAKRASLEIIATLTLSDD